VNTPAPSRRLHVHDGQDQKGRFPPALDGEYFRVDEWSQQDLLALAAGHARQLRYFDAGNQPAGDWHELFDADEALQLALIISRDRSPGALRHGTDSASADDMAAEVERLAAALMRWRGCLQRCDGVGAVTLARLIDGQWDMRLGSELAQVRTRFGADTWGPDNLDRLRTSLALFIAALERVREVASEQWAPSQHSGTHDPAAALLVAFVQLFATVQKHINRFTDRHTDFYYHDVLRMQPLPAQADAVHLALQREPTAAADVVVPAGTAFHAGKDAQGQMLEFVTDSAVTVTDARVAALCTLRLERDPLISPEVEFGFVNRARASRLPEPAAFVPGKPLPAWPVFGGTEQQLAGDSESALFGLAIASPQLLLHEGEREVRLTLWLGHAALHDPGLLALVKRHAEPDAATPPLSAADRAALLAELFQAYGDVERQAPATGAPSAATLAAAATADLVALPLAQRNALHYYRHFLLHRVLLSQGPALPMAVGRLFTHWLSAPVLADGSDSLATPDGQRVLDALRPHLGPELGDRTLAFARLFTGVFAASYSAPNGWRDVPQAYVVRPQTSPNPDDVGLQVVLRLGTGEPAVVPCDGAVHGPALATTLPVVRLQLRSFGGMFAYSLLEPALLRAVQVAVSVRGLRQVVLHNNLGRLDPGKPFGPFGPLPALGSYLLLGAAELAPKRLTALSVNLLWGGLPTGQGGFASHYAGYPAELDNRSFRVALSVLRDGQWQPVAPATRRPPLFASDDPAGPLDVHSTVSFEPAMLRNHFRACADLAGTSTFDQNARNGVLRLQLAAPDMAWGHAEYPVLLTEAVSANLRRKRHVPLPGAPYTPLLESLSVDYTADSVIRPGQGAAAAPGPGSEQVFHLHPFGVQALGAGGPGGAARLIPRYVHDGNLFIGLQASQLQGRLTLLFHLHDESAVARDGPHPAVCWSYLAHNTWRAMSPAMVLSDSTQGLLTSGIVVLELPADIGCDNTVMPGGLYWLSLGAETGFDRFAGLHSVRAQAVLARRAHPEAAGARALPPGSVTGPVQSLPGLMAVAQVGVSFGLRPAETRRQMRLRTGERLRHRQRASLPWDYERLVLERFPEVGKVKCFSAQELPGAPAGRLLVAVVPSAQRFDRDSGTLYPQMNAIELKQIAELLRELSSPFAQVQVRNASYERVQVRCAVRLAANAPVGASLRRVDRCLFDFLSPWVEGGLQARFGWVLRQEDIEARLRALDCVEFVTGLSMLHITRSDDGFFALGDTARHADPRPAPAAATVAALKRVEVRPAAAWSVLVPMAQHMVSPAPGPAVSAAQETGLCDLSVGSNFIIGGAGHG
jgi:hypothetical protein